MLTGSEVALNEAVKFNWFNLFQIPW